MIHSTAYHSNPTAPLESSTSLLKKNKSTKEHFRKCLFKNASAHLNIVNSSVTNQSLYLLHREFVDWNSLV